MTTLIVGHRDEIDPASIEKMTTAAQELLGGRWCRPSRRCRFNQPSRRPNNPTSPSVWALGARPTGWRSASPRRVFRRNGETPSTAGAASPPNENRSLAAVAYSPRACSGAMYPIEPMDPPVRGQHSVRLVHGDAEVGEHGLPGDAEQDVGWLHVAVHDPGPGRHLQRIQRGEGQPYGLRGAFGVRAALHPDVFSRALLRNGPAIWAAIYVSSIRMPGIGQRV